MDAANTRAGPALAAILVALPMVAILAAVVHGATGADPALWAHLTEHVLAQPGRSEELAARTMVGRNGVPEDFCGASVFLASDASSFITGQSIVADGGLSVMP